MNDLASTAITTARLQLVPVSDNYASDIFREFTEDITTYMFPKSPDTIADTHEFIATSRMQLLAGESLNVAIINLKSGEFIGGAGINHMDTTTPEFGIWIKAGAHGHKYGQESVHGLKAWAENHLSYDHFVYPVDKRNIASRKIAESMDGVEKREYAKTNRSGKELAMVDYWIFH